MRGVIVAVGILALLIWAMPVQAQVTTYTWTGAAGDGKYLTGGNWDPTGPPAVGDDGKCQPIIDNGDTVT